MFRWHKDLGRETVEDERRSGHPASVTTSTNVDPVRAFMRQHRRLTVRMTANEFNECTVNQIVTQGLNMRKMLAKITPRNLNDDQKTGRNEISAEML